MASFQERIIRAAKLDVDLYEEVEADQEAMGQAMGVVILSALAAGVASFGQAGFRGILVSALVALITWYIWAFLTFIIGTRLLPEPQTRADYGQLLRTIGFSSAPGIVRILGIIPGLGGLVFFFANIWMLVAMVIAVRQALDYTSTWRAICVCAVGWIVQALILGLVLYMFGRPT